jgi:hypothetical protein
MANIFLLGLILGALSNCATTEPPWVGGDPQSLTRDRHECQRDAESVRAESSLESVEIGSGLQQSQPGPGGFTLSPGAVAGLYSQSREQRMLEECMRARGWHLQR